MKKRSRIFSAILALLMMSLSLFSVLSSADDATPVADGEPKYIIDFSSERANDLAEKFQFYAPGECTMELLDYSAKFTATKDTANWFLSTNADFKADDTRFVKMRIKNGTDGNSFEFWASSNPWIKNLEISIQLYEISTKDSAWKEYVFEINDDAMVQGKWEGDIKRLRIDFPVNPNPRVGESVEVDYIAFFGTEAEANDFDIGAWEAAHPARFSCYEGLDLTKADPSYILDLREANKAALEAATCIPLGASQGTLTYTDTYATFTASQNNANPGWGFKAPEYLDTNACRYIKICIKNNSKVPGFEMWHSFFREATGTQMRKNIVIPISTEDTEFQTYIIKLDDAYSGNTATAPWYGRLGVFRLDFVDSLNTMTQSGQIIRAQTGESVDVQYVAYFATQEQAEAFDILKYRAGAEQATVAVTVEMPTAPTTKREPLEGEGNTGEENTGEENTGEMNTEESTTETHTNAPEIPTQAPTGTSTSTKKSPEPANTGCNSVIGAGGGILAVLAVGLAFEWSRKRRK